MSPMLHPKRLTQSSEARGSNPNEEVRTMDSACARFIRYACIETNKPFFQQWKASVGVRRGAEEDRLTRELLQRQNEPLSSELAAMEARRMSLAIARVTGVLCDLRNSDATKKK